MLDAGTFEIDTTPTILIASGQSTVVGGSFVGILDSLDAGQSFAGYLYDASSLSQVQDPNSWYAVFSIAVAPPTRPTPPPPSLPGVSASCGVLEGASIFAQDGTFLGIITSNTFDASSIGNPFGPYGSQFSPTSIFNPFGNYGSQFSPSSAFNQFANSPPVIYVRGVAVAYLTTNPFKTPGINPTALYPCIGR